MAKPTLGSGARFAALKTKLAGRPAKGRKSSNSTGSLASHLSKLQAKGYFKHA